ncbi:MAG: hypothetical protein AB8G17_04840 [Gammaproteobacteria bacterium]
MADQFDELSAFMARHRLPASFAITANEYFAPLGQWLEKRCAPKGGATMVLGINGAQGTGKSTLSNFLAEYLARQFGRNVVELSIDDIYLTRAERQNLARDVHPLLVTRGVPGTHDLALGCSVIDALQCLESGQSLPVPRFDKSTDDRVPKRDWPLAAGPVDVIILEGWCVGSKAQSDSAVAEPMNELEADEDADGVWRRFVNDQLADHYPALFGRLDALVYLEAPGFESVRTWRTEQEAKLRAVTSASAQGLLSDREVLRFVAHFERVTRDNFERLPKSADAVISLGTDHGATGIRFRL